MSMTLHTPLAGSAARGGTGRKPAPGSAVPGAGGFTLLMLGASWITFQRSEAKA